MTADCVQTVHVPTILVNQSIFVKMNQNLLSFYADAPSAGILICASVCPSVPHGLTRKQNKCRKSKTGLHVPEVTSNRQASFQCKLS